jgi:hypothetical protein
MTAVEGAPAAGRRRGGPPLTAVLGLLVAVTTLTGCSDGLAVSLSDPQTVTLAAAGQASATADGDPSEPASPEPTEASSSAPEPPETVTSSAATTSRRPAKWGGGTRVGTFGTRGTVVGDDGSGPQRRIAVGTCDLAHDVRTVTVTLDEGAVLVVHVTGPNLGELKLTAPGEPDRTVEYVGDATPVITLTPTRTEVSGALLVPPAGSKAPPVRLDASFDC